MEAMRFKLTQADGIRRILDGLPKRIKDRRSAMPQGRRGINVAALECGISPVAFARIEKGGQPNLTTLLALLDWLES